MTDAEQSGLAYLRQFVGGPASPIGRLLGLRLVAVSEGEAVIDAQPTPDHYNPNGVVHGGYFATVIDSALGCAVQTVLPREARPVTVELKVNFVRPVTVSAGRLICRGRVLHGGRKMQIAEARLEDEAGKLYGLGSGTFMTTG